MPRSGGIIQRAQITRCPGKRAGENESEPPRRPGRPEHHGSGRSRPTHPGKILAKRNRWPRSASFPGKGRTRGASCRLTRPPISFFVAGRQGGYQNNGDQQGKYLFQRRFSYKLSAKRVVFAVWFLIEGRQTQAAPLSDLKVLLSGISTAQRDLPLTPD